ncbi:MAG: energy-coupling factor transporter transmembrane protein EcfT [Euryarchaeota archaeon]|nr:energy-coupling factor transporter transmembrane protein EcfT [Euryarchaeota archaeon]
MTRFGFERHLPNLGLITHFSERGSSLVHQVSPWTKIALLPVLIFDVTVVSDITLLFAILMLVVFLFWIAKLPLLLLVYWCTLPVFFVVSIGFLLVWTVPGYVLVSYGSLQLTLQGIVFLAALMIRALTGVIYSLIILMTTKYNYLTRVVSKTLPYPLNQIALLSYRFIFLAFDGLDATLTAMESRGGLHLSSFSKRGRFYGSVFALAFIRSFDHAERVAKAMQSRGYDGRLTASYNVPRPSYWGYACIILTSCASIYYYLRGVF